MESIKRLREYGARFNNSHDAWSGIGTEILEFADEIDSEVDDMWHLLTIDAKPMTDENMAESGWVRLPVDADGVPIHVGDVMEWVDEPGITRTVTSIQLANDGWWVYISGTGRRPYKYRHHRAPTVEDMLREMLEAWGELPSNVTNEAIIAKYAAKLQLKED